MSGSQVEKKSLGKGLEDVSNLFLSNNDEKGQKQIVEGFSSLIIRKETCASCTHLIDHPPAEPKCRIFTFESEKHGVPHMDAISLSYAENCKHFQPNTSMNTGKKGKGRSKGAPPDEDEHGIEEAVSVHRRIAYPNTENAQQSMRKALFKYFEDGFHIRSMTLRKTIESSFPGKTEKREEITVFVKGS